MPLSFLHSFWQKLCCDPYIYFPVCNILFPLATFKIFLSITGFHSNFIMPLGVVLFLFILGVYWGWSMYCSHHIYKICNYRFFSSQVFLLCSDYSPTCVWPLNINSQVTEALSIFLSISFPLVWKVSVSLSSSILISF